MLMHLCCAPECHTDLATGSIVLQIFLVHHIAEKGRAEQDRAGSGMVLREV